VASLGARIKHAYSAFSRNEPEKQGRIRPSPQKSLAGFGSSNTYRPDRTRLSFSNERSIVAGMYTRLSIDAASIDIRHIRMDQNRRYIEEMKSGLNECLNVQANIDQKARQFRQDIFMSIFDSGVIAIVPVITDNDPDDTGTYDIRNMRVAEITQWFPKHVEVNLYNEETGLKELVTMPKTSVAIVENPLYNVMNEPNSTLQRLIHKLNLLDAIDEQSGSGKLDLIIQLPYVIKSDERRAQAEKRRADIEMQLQGSKYGIAYTDGTEKVTQLNRPSENNMLKQVEYLTSMLYGQLGLTESVFNGTADEKTMLNYHNRTIEPLLTAVTEAMRATFLTKTARTQYQSVEFFRNPFRLLGLQELAELADKLTRNEIMSSNEFRGVLAMKPVDDPKADELRNKNLPEADAPPIGPSSDDEPVRFTATPVKRKALQNGS
jgi:hypothetical protein